MPKTITFTVPDDDDDESGDPLKSFAEDVADFFVATVDEAYFYPGQTSRRMVINYAVQILTHLDPVPPPVKAALTRKAMGDRVSRAVWDRDDWTCQACGTHRALTVDHVIAVANGGTDDFDNLQTLCRPCNSKKGAS